MPKYLVEVTHDASKEACHKAIEIFKKTGSHFLTNSYWGCSDDVHKAWILTDQDKKEDAQSLVPPWYRDKSTVITLKKEAFGTKDQEIKHHKD